MKKLLRYIVDFIAFNVYSKKVTLIGRNQKFYRTTSIILSKGSTAADVKINENARIYGTLISCNGGKITIGKWVHFGPGSRIGALNEVIVGDYSGIAGNVSIIDNNNHPTNPEDRKIMFQTPEGSFERSWVNSDSKPIIIGENVWIGEYSRICKGVRIGENAIVAANSVVTKDVPANAVVAGNPAKVVKTDIDVNTTSIFTKKNV